MQTQLIQSTDRGMKPRTNDSAELMITSSGVVKKFPLALERNPTTLGRERSNHVVLTDLFVSQRHAQIERIDEQYVIRDFRSRNGTYINNVKVMQAVLKHGDRISLGQTEIIFCNSSSLELEADFQNTEELKSRCPGWQSQLKTLPTIAQSNLPVLILGESGTGKDVIAQHIHRFSGRRDYRFVAVNCSALSESLIESELFGHVRGSFTGASHDRKGAFESARGGTLFLDEIGDLPLNLQPKLLRALENNEIRPVGSDQSIKTDVRILAATHHDLTTRISEGKFRKDLYYRLNVIRLTLPPLRDRKQDLCHLIFYFARQYRVRFSEAAIQKLSDYDWPGNIRELKNVVARASALFIGTTVTEPDISQLVDPLPEMVTHVSADRSVDESTLIKTHEEISAQYRFPDTLTLSRSAGGLGRGTDGDGHSVLKEIEKQMIIRQLTFNLGNQRQTAIDLGMPKSTLNDRIRVYGININECKTRL